MLSQVWQFRRSQDMLVQDNSVYVLLLQVITRYAMLGQVRSGWTRLGQVRMVMTCEASLGNVRLC
jgi:hypothetical protein